MTMSSLQCQVITDEALLAAVIPEWRSLQVRCMRTIFTAPCWLEAWWHSIGKHQGYRLHVVTARRDGRLVAVAPLAVIRRKGVRLLHWAAADACDYSDFLLESPEDASALLDAVRNSPHYDLAQLREVEEQAFSHPVLMACAVPVKTSQARNIRSDGKSFDAWLATLSYSQRKQYRVRTKQANAIGELRYEVIREGPVPDAAIGQLITQKKEWLAAVDEPSLFDSPGVHGFYRAITDAAAAEGTLHFSLLYCGPELIATHLGFIQGERFLSYMPSYSVKRSMISPGRLLMFHCIAWAFGNGCTEYDFMRGAEGYKHSFASHARNLTDFLFARGLKGKLVQFLYLQRAKRRKPA